MTPEERVLVVRIGDSRVGLAASRVRCISRRPHITWTGRSEGGPIALACVDGDPVVVRSATYLLELEVVPYERCEWLVVTDADMLPAPALAVDDVLGLFRASDDLVRGCVRPAEVRS